MTTQPDNRKHVIVVGVDGSGPSKAALGWAVRQARLTDAAVDAVIAWEFPAVTGYPVQISDVDWEELARQVVSDAIGEVRGPAGPVLIRARVMRGNAAEVLLAESAGADLLVVGSRGHGGFVGALLGSVGQHCVQHARCPVVVIRDSAAG